jgi:hypothetical protein
MWTQIVVLASISTVVALTSAPRTHHWMNAASSVVLTESTALVNLAEQTSVAIETLATIFIRCTRSSASSTVHALNSRTTSASRSTEVRWTNAILADSSVVVSFDVTSSTVEAFVLKQLKLIRLETFDLILESFWVNQTCPGRKAQESFY